jgi:hypothetical protein
MSGRWAVAAGAEESAVGATGDDVIIHVAHVVIPVGSHGTSDRDVHEDRENDEPIVARYPQHSPDDRHASSWKGVFGL